MVKSKEELLAAIKELAGENVTSDAAIALIEDVSDTLDVQNDGTDWKKEAERIDAEWRQKYTDRFFRGEDPEDPEDPEEPEEKTYKYEDLFVEEEDKKEE